MNQATKSKYSVIGIFNTNILMVLTAGFLGILGFAALFLPQEILDHYGLASTDLSVILMKITGALYLGFSVLNWMARSNIIGAIYSRPVALGNFMHFTIVTIILLRYLTSNEITSEFVIGAAIYSIFAICFGYLLFGGKRACQ